MVYKTLKYDEVMTTLFKLNYKWTLEMILKDIDRSSVASVAFSVN